MQFTKDQQQVIDVHQKNILVAAAAGSGKTAVLVERIVQMISDPTKKIDIDRMLVVTFTKAAAAEMRERIGNALTKRLSMERDNKHLQKQLTLIHNAQITTIDSFCLFVLRNNFNEVGLDPTFRVADEGERKLLEEEVLKEVLENKFEENHESFIRLVESFGKNGKDDVLEEQIKKLRDFSMSYPFPELWLDELLQSYADVNAPYLSFAYQYCQDILNGIQRQITYAMELCQENEGPYMYQGAIESDGELVQKLLGAKSLEELSRIQLDFASLGRQKKGDEISEVLKEQTKTIRDGYKDEIKKLKDLFWFAPFEDMQEDLEQTKEVIEELISVVKQFEQSFYEKKREKNIIDFHDMEHLALKILVRLEQGEPVPTKVALAYQDYFAEILIDEYQDSNLVQEYLLMSIAKNGENHNNRFMVGDVKQSIYRFRLARPDLFMEKFVSYRGTNPGNIRIDLHQNFRSREEILEASNLVFEQIMQQDLGGVIYDEDAKLNVGASYPETLDHKVELVVADLSKFGEADTKVLAAEAREIEARVVAKKIKEAVGSFSVLDKGSGELRPAKYKDIVILLRAFSGWADTFYKILTEEGIPTFVDSKSGYFSATEVQFVLDFLKVLDNPLQDIPLCDTLLSIPFGFTEEDLAEIRITSNDRTYQTKRKEKLFEAIRLYTEADAEDELSELQKKCKEFLELVSNFREKVTYEPIHQLLREIYSQLHVYDLYSIMPEGEQRSRNLDMLLEKAINFERTSYHGLFHFNQYINQLHKYEVDFGEATELEETADVVQIMTIHKSKGLEFPICIVAGNSKNYNTKDLNASFVIEGDLGVGMEYVNLSKRITRPTIRKNALSLKMKLDSIGEELRVLYVAMTRAKEKLILTASVDCLEETLKDYAYLQVDSNIGLPFLTKVKAKSYFELILASLVRHRSMSSIFETYGTEQNTRNPVFQKGPEIRIELLGETELEIHEQEVGVKKELIRQSFEDRIMRKQTDFGMDQLIKERFLFRYPYLQSKPMYTKTTVSELKMNAMEEETHALFEESKRDPYLPAFMREEKEITGSVRGSAFHRFLELLSFDACIDQKEIERKLEEFAKKGKMPAEYVSAILPFKMERFMNSEIASRMIQAKQRGQLYKEQPFVLSIQANRVDPEFPSEETILVQGIIDVFFEEENELVVLDYKTDFVSEPRELIDRYKTQLEYYGEALEKLTGKRVKERWIYSFALGMQFQI